MNKYNSLQAVAFSTALIASAGVVTLKYQTETGVRNRAAGDALWLKAAFPL